MGGTSVKERMAATQNSHRGSFFTIVLVQTSPQLSYEDAPFFEKIFTFAQAHEQVALKTHEVFDSMKALYEYVSALDTEYIIFLGTTHVMTESYLEEIFAYIAQERPLYATGHTFITSVRSEDALKSFKPNNYHLLEGYQHIYGCAYNTRMLCAVADLYCNYDVGSLYALFCLYTHEYERKKLPIGYSLSNPTHMGNGLPISEATYIFPITHISDDLFDAAPDLRLYMLNVLQLYIRYALLHSNKLPFSFEHMSALVSHYKLDEISGVSVYEYP
ncbi:MAG: hypothetical protein IJV62_01630, partial [Eggerthellaceae bacterium]|nr:hypothetical protein [Eggerthellaceae bacterium]